MTFVYHLTERANITGIRQHGLRSVRTGAFDADDRLVYENVVWFLDAQAYQDARAHLDRLNRDWKDPVAIRMRIGDDVVLQHPKGLPEGWFYVALPEPGYFRRPIRVIELGS